MLLSLRSSQIAEHGLKSELITGSKSAKDRSEAVQRFQDGLTPVFIGTFGSAGVGITLTRASTVILLDREWTPGDVFQAEDRINRIGQSEVCKCLWLSAFPWDEQVDAMIKAKDVTSAAVIENNGAPGSTGEAQAQNAKISIQCLINHALQEANRVKKGGAGEKAGVVWAKAVEFGGGDKRQTTLAGFLSQDNAKPVRLSHSND